MALESFEIINKDCPVILQDLLTIKHNRYNFRYHNTVEVPHTRTNKALALRVWISERGDLAPPPPLWNSYWTGLGELESWYKLPQCIILPEIKR